MSELEVETIPVDKVDIAEENVRFEEGDDVNRSLQRSIKRQGLLQDIVGRWDGDRFKVIIGRNRFLALEASGVEDITAKVTDLKGYDAIAVSLSENVHRSDIDPVSRARSLKRLEELDPDGLDGVSESLGISKSTLHEWIRILDLEDSMLDLVKRGKISFSNALKIARSNMDGESQKLLAKQIEERGQVALKGLTRKMGIERRGAPKGLYSIRFTFLEEELMLYNFVKRKARELGMEEGNYVKSLAIPAIRDEMAREMITGGHKTWTEKKPSLKTLRYIHT